VNADEVAVPRAVVGELVGGAGGRGDDVAGPGVELSVIELEGEMAFVDDPGLVVGPTVQPGAVPGRAVVEDQRDARLLFGPSMRAMV
jgi:hypothetical protein